MHAYCSFLTNLKPLIVQQGKDQMLEVDTTAFGNTNPFSGSGEGAQDGPPPPYESVVMHDGVSKDGRTKMDTWGDDDV